MRILPCLLVTFTALAACGRSQTPAEPGDLGPLLATEAAGTTVVEEAFSALAGPRTAVISSEAGWRRTWAAIYANQSPLPPLPAVDFTRQVLVLDALGSTTDGATNRITAVRFHERGTLVLVEVSVPGPQCLILTAIGQPVHVIAVPRPDTLNEQAYARRERVVRECL